MKMSKIAALAAALALVAAGAMAQTAPNYTGALRNVVSSPDGSCYNAATNQRVDCTTGVVLGTETNPFYDVLLGPTVIIGPAANFTTGTADSNAVPLDTHRATSGTLYLNVWKTAGTTGSTTPSIARFAVSVRGHLSAGTDSLSTFALHPALPMQTVTTDSVAIGHTRQGSSTVAWPEEFIVTVDLNRGSPLNSFTQSVAFTYPHGIAVNLARIYGPSLGLSYMSVRVRQIVGPACLATVTYEGRL